MNTLDQLLRDLDPVHDTEPISSHPARFARLLEAGTGSNETGGAARADSPGAGTGSNETGGAARADSPEAHMLPTPPTRSPRRRPSRRSVLAGVGLAASVALFGVVATQVTAPPPSASAQMVAAARELVDANSGRFTTNSVTAEAQWRSVGEFSGASMRFTYSQHYADRVESQEFIGIDDTVWVRYEGQPWQVDPPSPGNPRLFPLPHASEAVIEALASSEQLVTEETPTGAVHRVALDEPTRAALRALQPGEVSWFGLENPETATAISVTVGDGAVREIRVTYEPGHWSSSFEAKFFDLGTPVTIEPPR